MTTSPTATDGDQRPGGMAFGPFRLFPREHLLTSGDMPLRLSGKPLAILIALASRPGELIDKERLFEEVWPTVTVAEGALRVHVAALRKALTVGGNAFNYIQNVPGKGYRFNGEVSPIVAPGGDQVANEDRRRFEEAGRIPSRSSTMIGRDALVSRLSEQFATRRLVTIVGPGGVGKTTLALAVSEAIRLDFEEVRFVDLSASANADLVPTAIALAFGLSLHAVDPAAALAEHLRGKRSLLVLDGCEHLIESAALAVERILAVTPRLHILATSREALRISEERVHRLGPLACPPESEEAVEAIGSYPAVALFVSRATIASQDFLFVAETALKVAAICRALDGLPLAIELAVGQLDVLGLDGIALGIADLFSLLARGRRTASPRHQTLKATLDWSYRLLSSDEQDVLRRLGVFRASFVLDSAVEIAGIFATPRESVRDLIAGLAAKSMISVDTSRESVAYRLLDTTRAYSRLKLSETGEAERLDRHHAHHVLSLLRDRADLSWRGNAPPRISNAEVIDDLRAALRWAFSPGGEAEFRTALTFAAATVLMEMALLQEARSWIDKGIESLAPQEHGSLSELNLRLARLGSAPSIGASDANLAALLELAERFDDRTQVIFTLEVVYLIRLRVADYSGALDVARRITAILPHVETLRDRFSAEWMLGVAHHFLGHHSIALELFAETLNRPTNIAEVVRFSGHPKLYTHCFRARSLWMTGLEAAALREMNAAIATISDIQNPMMICVALVWLCHLAIWMGDLSLAETLNERLAEIAARNALGPQLAMANAYRGQMTILRGDAEAGIEQLRFSLRRLGEFEQEMLVPVIYAAIATGQAQLGRLAEGLAAGNHALDAALKTNGMIFLPEIHLLRARLLHSIRSNTADIVQCAYQEALDSACRQEAWAWEARIVPPFAAFLVEVGNTESARAIIDTMVDRHKQLALVLTPDLVTLNETVSSIANH